MVIGGYSERDPGLTRNEFCPVELEVFSEIWPYPVKRLGHGSSQDSVVLAETGTTPRSSSYHPRNQSVDSSRVPFSLWSSLLRFLGCRRAGPLDSSALQP